jgi:hypothetical protein
LNTDPPGMRLSINSARTSPRSVGSRIAATIQITVFTAALKNSLSVHSLAKFSNPT